MNLARERLLCIEVYKTLNSLNPCLNILVVNQVTYGTKSLRSFVPKIWNSLPHHVKSAEKLKKKLLIIGMACLVTVLFVAWKTFHKNLLGAYHISAFLFIVIYIYYIYIYTHSPPGLSRF